MGGRTCFFIGHRDTEMNVYPLLVEAVEQHIAERGVTSFFVGHYGAFDRMAGKAVIEAKKHHPDVQLMLVLPYHPAVRPFKIPSRFDGSYYPEGQETVPKRLAIIRANEHMIRTTDYLICFVKHPSAGSREVLENALKRQKRGLISVTNLSGWDPII